MLAKELATLDVLSEGRLQVGLGAGWLRQEYEDASIRFDPASVRIERLEETAIILKGLFGDEPFTFDGEHYTIGTSEGSPTPVQRPRPPIMIGGGRPQGPVRGGPTGRHRPAHAEQPGRRDVLDPSQFSAPAIEEKVGWIRDAAGSASTRSSSSAQLLECAVTDRPEEHLATSPTGSPRSPNAWAVAASTSATTTCGTSPIVAVGSARRGLRTADRDPRSLRDQLLRRADRRQARSPRSDHRSPRRRGKGDDMKPSVTPCASPLSTEASRYS